MTREKLIKAAAERLVRNLRSESDMQLDALQYLAEQLGRAGDYAELRERVKRLEDKVALFESVGQRGHRGL